MRLTPCPTDCRYLAIYLADYKRQQDNGTYNCLKRGPLAALYAAHLSPIIWVIVIVLQVVFTGKVISLPPIPMSSGQLALSWLCIASSAIGLVFLYKTSTADPGHIPR